MIGRHQGEARERHRPPPGPAGRHSAVTLVLAVLLLLAPGASGVRAEERVQPDERTRLLSYECLPSLAESAAPYEVRAAVTARLADELVPAVLAILDIPADQVETRVAPGGYLRHTNPSLQSGVSVAEADAERLAAALGYVCRQDGVLITDFTPETAAETGGEGAAAGNGDAGGGDAGPTGYVLIGFPEATLTPVIAQAFFSHAATVEPALGGGYTALGDTMVFLNLRDEAGQALGGLTDETFTLRLGQAVASFAGPPARVIGTGEARALLVANDWTTAPLGGDYLSRLGREGVPLTAQLAALQARRASIERSARP